MRYGIWLTVGIVAALVLGCLGACGDDDGNGSSPAADSCDVDCYRATRSDLDECFYDFWDCLDSGGTYGGCWDSIFSCRRGAFYASCDCYSPCAGCGDRRCECIDNCGGWGSSGGECGERCFDEFYECASWYDEDCMSDCSFEYFSCEYDHTESNDFVGGRDCVDALTECEFACLPD